MFLIICRTISTSLATAGLLLSLAGDAHSEAKTLTIPVPEGRDEITYDASRIQLSDLQHLLVLSPILSQNTGLLLPPNIWSCDHDNPATHCGSGWWFDAGNAKYAQDNVRKNLDKLQHETFPPDFSPIVDYFKTTQSFGFWVNQQQIDFFKKRDISVLERKYEPLHIDPKISCAHEIDEVRKSTDEIAEWKLVVFKFHNCLNVQFHATAGEYPQAVWDAALKKRGIRETLIVDDGQDN
jgi:hypothetical protein